jgi:hypothetical protein
MAFNPKVKTLKELTPKDMSKRSLKLLGKKFNSPAKMAPFFIKLDFEYADGTVGPLFIFGKIKKFKSEIKPLKGVTELHGLAYIEYDEKGKPTLCLSPTKGKLAQKEMQLKKAMKETFTSAFSAFRILDEISEEQAEAAAEAAEQMSDEAEDLEEENDEVSSDSAPSEEAPKSPRESAINQLQAKVSQLGDLLKKIEDNTDEQTHYALDKEFRTLLADIQGGSSQPPKQA